MDGAYSDTLGEPGSVKVIMLDELLNANEQSRLACQIDINSEFDRLVVTIPPEE